MKRLKSPRRRMAKLERTVHRERTAPARVFRVHPQPGLPHVVEVRIARNRRRMHDEMRRMDNAKGDDINPLGMGLVRYWFSKRQGKATVLRPRMMVARMYLNAADLRASPAEIVSHECTHAGMAWARFRRANLSTMVGEEVLAYAVGRLTEQVNRVAFAMGVWR